MGPDFSAFNWNCTIHNIVAFFICIKGNKNNHCKKILKNYQTKPPLAFSELQFVGNNGINYNAKVKVQQKLTTLL